jgi:hypothetical protein
VDSLAIVARMSFSTSDRLILGGAEEDADGDTDGFSEKHPSINSGITPKTREAFMMVHVTEDFSLLHDI